MKSSIRVFTLGAFVLALAFVSGGSAQASYFVNNFGLTSPTSTLTFDEIVSTRGDGIDTEYADFGETFDSELSYDTQGSAGFPGITGHYLGNFDPTANPFSISFKTDLTEAAFGLATNPATTIITALLNGRPVESFSVSTTFDDPAAGFYGFTGITFDEINISVSTLSALVDNIQTGKAAVPEPSTMLLLGLGLMGVAGIRRKLTM